MDIPTFININLYCGNRSSNYSGKYPVTFDFRDWLDRLTLVQDLER